MKPTTTVADFIRRGREAGQDGLGLAQDPDAIMTLAAIQRDRFLRERTEETLRRWRQLVAGVVTTEIDEPEVVRWIAIEHVRLDRAFKAAAADDPTVSSDAARWTAALDDAERDEVRRRFDLDLMAPLTMATAGSRG